MNVLAIDTSNHVLGVAVMKNEQVIGEIVTNLTKNHSTRLMPAVDTLMKEIDMKPEDLDQIAVAEGPGSYTGVRIGLTTAKTLAWALHIPIVGVSSLEVLAYQGSFFDGYICPFFDARRGFVYAGVYQWKNNQLISIDEDQNIMMNAILEKLKSEKENILFLSPDMDKFRQEILEQLGDKAIIPDEAFHIAKPSHLGLASIRHDAEEVHGLTPSYLRLAEAEAIWLKQQKEKENHE